MNAQEIWDNKWPFETHNCEYAFKRMKSAQSVKLTPVSIDKENASGVFKGSGKEPYQVTLENCTCGDFHRAHLPCKHMYRLAAELDIMVIDTESYNKRGYTWEEIADVIEELSDDAQKEFAELITGAKNNTPINRHVRKNDAINELTTVDFIKTGKETPKYIDISIDIDHTAEIFMVNQYFGRKFSPPYDISWEPDASDMSKHYKPLANDSRTKRLLEKGFATKTLDGTFIIGCEGSSEDTKEHVAKVGISGIKYN